MSFDWAFVQAIFVSIVLVLYGLYGLLGGWSGKEVIRSLRALLFGFFSLWLITTIAGVLDAALLGKIFSFFVGCIVFIIIFAKARQDSEAYVRPLAGVGQTWVREHLRNLPWNSNR